MSKLRILQLCSIALISFLYFPLLNGYFLQDEWFAFGKLYYESQFGLGKQILNYFTFDVAHYVPLHHVVFLLFQKAWGLRYEMWSGASVLWHLVNVYLVYRVSQKAMRDNYAAALIALLFGLSASTYQATAWIGANVNTHGATTFTLISVYYFFQYLEMNSSKYLNYSLAFLVVSLLFKEIAIGTFGVYFLYLLTNANRKRSFIVFITGFTYIFFRGMMVLFSDTSSQSIATQTQSYSEIFINLITFPIHIISQIIIPQQFFTMLSYRFASLIPEFFRPMIGTTSFDLFVQNTVMVLFSIVLFSIFLLSVLRIKLKLVRFFIFFAILNSFVFALSPERSGKIVVMDSRNMYLVSFAIFSLIVLFVINVVKNEKLKLALLTLTIIVNSYFLYNSITTQSQAGQLRRMIVDRVMSDIKKAGNIIIYTKSDTSYYGLSSDNKTLPFQSGFGHTILVNVAYRDMLDPNYFKDRFLWEIADQGFKVHSDRAFGYFRDEKLLKEILNTYTIEPDEIYAYKWENEITGFSRITDVFEVEIDHETN